MAEPYRKGEYVRYSCNGVCLVDDIRMDTLGKEAPKEFYILKPVSNPASTIFVPTASQALVDRMARLPNQEELDQLILSTRDKEIPWIEDRKVRLASFQAIIKTCDLRDLICLAVCLYQRQRTLSAVGKKLGSSDETILHRTEALIENQVSFVLQGSTDLVFIYLRDTLTPAPATRHAAQTAAPAQNRRGGCLFFYLAYCIRPHTSSAYRAGSGRGKSAMMRAWL